MASKKGQIVTFPGARALGGSLARCLGGAAARRLTGPVGETLEPEQRRSARSDHQAERGPAVQAGLMRIPAFLPRYHTIAS